MKAWKRFCLQENETRELCDIPQEELNFVLCKFLKTVKKLDGTEYEPVSLTSFKRSVQRSLKAAQMWILLTETTLNSPEKRCQLVVDHGKGNRPQAARELTEAEEDKLFDCGEFGTSKQTVLQRTLWWIIALHFGFTGRDESRRLKLGNVTLDKDPETENEILVWRYERGSKTRKGQDKPYSVRPNSPFYLAVKHQRKQDDDVWNMRSPLAKNEIGKFLPTAAKNAGLQGRVTNHSVRKTCISRLLDEDVPDNFVAQLSGHRSLKSLNAYKSASHERQRRMSLALSRSGSNQLASISTHTETTTRPITSVTSVESATFNPVQMGSGFFSGATIESFNNCTFNIRLTSGQLCTTEPSDSSSKRPRIGKATTRWNELSCSNGLSFFGA